MTKSEQILRFIEASPDGRKFTEIQKFIVELNGHDWDTMERSPAYVDDPKPVWKRRWRGYYCTRLLGGPFYGDGLLHRFCKKKKGRWVLVKKIKSPFFKATPFLRRW